MVILETCVFRVLKMVVIKNYYKLSENIQFKKESLYKKALYSGYTLETCVFRVLKMVVIK